MTSSPPHLSVVVPCFNESEVIQSFHAVLLRSLEPTRETFEICYVDDGSSDRTEALLSGLAASDRRVRYTAFSRNFGKEAAMLAGLRMSRGDAVVLMDADLQHPPELVPRMLELHRRGYDQVVPRRDRAGEGILRTACSRVYYALVRRCMDVEVVDGAGDFRLLSRRAVQAVLSMPESNRFSKGIFSWIGFDTVSFEYRNVARVAGQSKWGGKRLLNYGVDGLLSFNTRPLRLAIHTGLLVFVSAFAYALWIIADIALNGASVPGYGTLLTAVVALSGVQLVTLGVIGEYVGRIYHEAKSRPPYVVRETSGGPTGEPAVDGPGPVPVPVPAPEPEPEPEPVPVPVQAPASVPVPPFVTEVSSLTAGRTGTARQFSSFVAIGFVNTAVYLAVYASLNSRIPYLLAHALGYAISIVVSFLLNSYITCGTRPTWRAFLRFPLSGAVNLVASGVLLYAAVSGLGMDRNISALIAGVLVTPFSFLIARWAITTGSRGAPTHDRPAAAPTPADRRPVAAAAGRTMGNGWGETEERQHHA